MKPLAAALGAGRIGVGVALLAAPGLGGSWIGRDAGRRRTQVMTRGLAARDLAIGIGTLGAVLTGRPAKGWMAAGAIGDVGDLAATLAAQDKLPESGVRMIAGLAGSAILISVAYVAFAERQPPPAA